MASKTGKKTSKRTPEATRRRPTGIQIGEANARGMILMGATRLFAERGTRAASVEDVLAASGISRRTFYRLYQSKEDILLALYRFGTDGLLDACRTAVSAEREPLRQLEACIDAHLNNARALGRLVFVLGGEAQRLESKLHARRMEVHDSLVLMLEQGLGAEHPVDPLLLRVLVLALEGVVRIILEDGDEGRHVTEAAIERARRVMYRMATATLVGTGPGVTELPTLP